MTDKDGNPLGKSRVNYWWIILVDYIILLIMTSQKAAVKGIGQVLLSRLFLVAPVMCKTSI